MAVFNGGFPMNYGYYQQPIMQQPQMQMPQQQMMPQQMQQTQLQQMQQPVQQQYPAVQSGFVRVRNENEARMYPVAPGSSVTFIDESGPFCYSKTVNMGQLDRPIFEKYRLVKEEDNPVQQPIEQPQKPVESPRIDVSQFVTKDVIDGFRSDLDNIRSDMETFKTDLYGIAGKKKPITKKEVASDE